MKRSSNSQKLCWNICQIMTLFRNIFLPVLMMAKKKFMVNGIWKTWIDFPKWHELINSGKEFTAEDYWKRTPQVGLSGLGTLDTVPEDVKKKLLQEHSVAAPSGIAAPSGNGKREEEIVDEKEIVDENTEELSFYN